MRSGPRPACRLRRLAALLAVFAVVAGVGLSLVHVSLDGALSGRDRSPASQQPHHDPASCPVCVVLASARASLPQAPPALPCTNVLELRVSLPLAASSDAAAPRRSDPARAPPATV